MKEAIKEFILGRDYVSFAELTRAIPKSAGHRVMHLDNDSLIVWDGVSQEFAEAVESLIRDDLIVARPCDSTVYTLSDRHPGLGYPIAKRIRKYAKPRWYPVTLNRPEGAA